MPWFFAFGLTCNLKTAREDIHSWKRYSKAVLRDYIYTFTGYHPNYNGGTSTVIPKKGGEVLGIAFEIDESQIEYLKQNSYGYILKEEEIFLKGNRLKVFTIQPDLIGELGKPSLRYFEEVKIALYEHYPKEVVDLYLARALNRTNKKGLNIRRYNYKDYKYEYGSLLRRIYPWKRTRKAPFGSGIIIVNPGEKTQPHNHDEEETFIILKGKGIVEADGEKSEVYPEDVIYFEPFSVHSISNNGDTPLKLLAVWWGAVGVEHYQLENQQWKE